MKMDKLIFFLLISFIFTGDSDINQYIVKISELIEIKESTACVCFELDKDLRKDAVFYLQFTCEDKDSSIEKMLNYNFLSKCEHKSKCDIYYLNNYKINDNPTIIKEEDTGFHYEYELKKLSDENNAVLIHYKNFTGITLTLEITSLSVKTIISIIIISIVIGLLFVATVVIIVVCIFHNKNKAKEINEQLKSSFIDDNQSNGPIISRDSLLD